MTPRRHGREALFLSQPLFSSATALTLVEARSRKGLALVPDFDCMRGVSRRSVACWDPLGQAASGRVTGRQVYSGRIPHSMVSLAWGGALSRWLGMPGSCASAPPGVTAWWAPLVRAPRWGITLPFPAVASQARTTERHACVGLTGPVLASIVSRLL